MTVRPNMVFSAGSPDELPCRVSVTLKTGERFGFERNDYPGFHTRPASWERVVEKFNALSSPFASRDVRDTIVDAVCRVDEMTTRDFTAALGQPMSLAV